MIPLSVGDSSPTDFLELDSSARKHTGNVVISYSPIAKGWRARTSYFFPTFDKSPEAQPMNVLARISKVSDLPAPNQVEAPQHVAPRSQEQPAPKPARPPAGPSILSAALTVTGRVESAGDIQIDGKVEGDVRGQAVRIGDGALIKGTVTGGIVELAGTIEGKIEAESVALAKTAHMSGDIFHRSLRIDTGAHFEGSSHPHRGMGAPKSA